MQAQPRQSWVEWFHSQPQGKYFIQIDSNFFRDLFNYYGLRQNVSHYKHAMELIKSTNYVPEQRPSDWPPAVETQAIKLYGLLHARYLLTAAALKEVAIKYQGKLFESCPRVNCQGIRCLPYGVYDEPGRSDLRLFCPCCHDVYTSEDYSFSLIDGAYFGHSYLLLLLQLYPDISKRPLERPDLRLFGFRIEPEDESETATDSET